MNKIDIMLSSTIRDLTAERDALRKVFSDVPFVNLIGADPLNDAAFASNANSVTISMAKNCELYILILGDRFGYKLADGRSATEIEFDAAFEADPTKILVFKKKFSGEIKDRKQKAFIKRVSNYYSGYWITSFEYTHDLQNFVMKSFTKWLKDRAGLGVNLSHSDHFIRIAKQFKPDPSTDLFYKVDQDNIEIEYTHFGNLNVIHFKRSEVSNNFWSCVYKLQIFFQNLKT